MTLLTNRQFYTRKFNSSYLKECGYNLDITFNEAVENNQMIALADSQILRIIRSMTMRSINYSALENFYEYRDKLIVDKDTLGKNDLDERARQIREIQNNINHMMYIPEYITIIMEGNTHYDYLHKHGLMLDGHKYVRFSCSASQGRVSTVVFIQEDISDELFERLNNGRDEEVELVPNKFNAYFGLNSSATKIVSRPKVCVVPDGVVKRQTPVNWVTEVDDIYSDDIIEYKMIDLEYNLWDGMGLISPLLAERWAVELGLDYTPSQWCIRNNFLKGMVCVFDFHQFCAEVNNKNYNIKTVYKDENGKNIIVDIRDYEMIVSESQFKLWNSFESYEEYDSNCIKNGLSWGVSIYSPKVDKDNVLLNYMFLQTLKLSDADIKSICEPTVSWLERVSTEDIYYTMLFMMGIDINEKSVTNMLKSSDEYWFKSLLVNNDLRNDRYIKEKIYNNIVNKAKNACIGKILADGNFTPIVSDPYAMMEHICGLEVKGLLGKEEYFSPYWSKKGVEVVDSMRSPLTYRSEHKILHLKNNDKMSKWYSHLTTGLVVNVFGDETLRWGGSDFDYDIICTVSNPEIINGVYQEELPVTYQAPKGEKVSINSYLQVDLQKADKFTFGSIIGGITNKITSIYSLLPLFKEGSAEYNVLIDRLKMGCKLQSAQIDKGKIGRAVKGIPKQWTTYQKVLDTDTEEEAKKKIFENSLLCDKHPYFFIYLYKDTYRKYKQHYNSYNLDCKRYGMTLNELIKKERKTKEQRELIDKYNRFMPVIDSNSEMNRICKYMESINLEIKNKVKLNDNSNDVVGILTNKSYAFNEDNYKKVFNVVKEWMKERRRCNINYNDNVSKLNDKDSYIINLYDDFKSIMDKLGINPYEITNYLIKICYNDLKSFNKDFLWRGYGKYIYENVKNNTKKTSILVPELDENGEIEYLNKKFSLKEVNFDD